MGLDRILVAADGSPHSDHALDVARRLAGRAGASLAVVQVEERVRAGSQRSATSKSPIDTAALVFRRDGVAGIEIARCAEEWRADLVVLGRNGHVGPGLGFTTDTVLRRRHGPTLLIPRSIGDFERVLYALDGTERGLRILEGDCHFPGLTGATPMAVCVLPPNSLEPVSSDGWRHPRVTRVEAAMARRSDLGGRAALAMRCGEPVDQVMSHLSDTAADLLVLGLRQGGPGGDPGSGHVARDLLSAVPVAILTIPI